MNRVFRAALLAALCAAGAALAQDYPARAIRLIVPFPPGGGMDGVGRPVAEKLAAILGQPVVLENRPGAAGNIGTEMAARAVADGYTLLVANDLLSTNPAIYKSVGFDPIKDFTPIARLGTVQMLLVVPASSPARDLKEIAAQSRVKPLSYGTPGIGSVPHFLGELLNLEGTIRILHVPYKGSGPAVADAIGGQIDCVLTTMPSLISHIRSGKLRAIAVPSSRRAEGLPDVPTFAEAGIAGIDSDIWYGLFAPSATPEPVLRRRQAATAQALAMPDLAERLKKSGYDLAPSTPEAFSAQIRADLERWRKVVADAKIPRE